MFRVMGVIISDRKHFSVYCAYAGMCVWGGGVKFGLLLFWSF